MLPGDASGAAGVSLLSPCRAAPADVHEGRPSIDGGRSIEIVVEKIFQGIEICAHITLWCGGACVADVHHCLARWRKDRNCTGHGHH